MIATETVRYYRPLSPAPTRQRSARRRWLLVAALLALLGVVVVGHGCHGEHVDDELSAVAKPRAGG